MGQPGIHVHRPESDPAPQNRTEAEPGRGSLEVGDAPLTLLQGWAPGPAFWTRVSQRHRYHPGQQGGAEPSQLSGGWRCALARGRGGGGGDGPQTRTGGSQPLRGGVPEPQGSQGEPLRDGDRPLRQARRPASRLSPRAPRGLASPACGSVGPLPLRRRPRTLSQVRPGVRPFVLPRATQ